MVLLVEMGWGGLVQYPATITWTDISTRVDQQRRVTISRGASDERSETQPGSATLTLDNLDGALTPGNTSSPWAPFVRKNAPIRIAQAVVPVRSGTAPYPLAMLADPFDDGRVDTARWPTNTGGATETPAARLRIPLAPGVDTNFASAREWKLTGSKLTAKLAKVPALNGSSNCAASMWITSTTGGTRIGWRYDAGLGVLAAQSQTGFADGASVNLTYSAIDHAWLRVREAAGTVYWETSGDGYAWTVRRTLATPAWVGAQTQAVDFPTTRTGGSSDPVEWRLVGAEVRPRFYGLVNEFPVDWSGLSSTVTISCTDLFKRLNRLPNLRSMAAEEIAAAGPVAYYPLTEPADSASTGDQAGGGAGALTIQQAGVGGTLALAGSPGPAATDDQVPLFTPSSATAGKWLSGDMGASVQQQLTQYWPVFEAWFQTSAGGRAILGLASPGLSHVHVLSLSAAGQLQIEWTNDGQTALTVELVDGATGLADGAWHHVVYDQYTGTVWVDGTLRDSALALTYGYEQRILHVGGYRGTRLWNGSLAHVAMYAVAAPAGAALAAHYAAGADGYTGEDADVRIQRLARYAGITSVTIAGTTHDPIASQGPGGAGLVARMRDVEATESGKLYAARDTFGLVYQSRDLRYNPDPAAEAFTVDYADLEPGTAFADDDQKMVNSVTAARPGGATQRVAAQQAITVFGEYPQSLDILKTNDNSVLDAAYWLVSRYANPAPELREVTVEAATLPAAFLKILSADISSYFTVYNLPVQAPAPSVRVTVEGYSETLKEQSHLITFRTSAAATDSVWVLDDAAYSVLDSTTRLAY
ncbi:hypothetical protein SZN_09206 [Streptomyces zinciresistens K42]|uniref:Uncharacterized protein n=1 Tax=Streptomyces zinciresistens K42 TaxID=700597 RepID=G2G8M3_9ACTN|nr:hypothetical protein [Streptomyces zinciresistens]EGX60088.1 hypothetical protein SZN_09206 [Streptomyces zinciresistens K42]